MSFFAHTSFEATEVDADRQVRLELRGELDIATIRQFIVALTEAERRRPELLVIDASGLVFIDARGFKVLLDAARRARREQRRLVLLNPDRQIARVLTITGVDRTVEVVRERAPPPR